MLSVRSLRAMLGIIYAVWHCQQQVIQYAGALHF
ncbi:MAG: hypothetical protein OJF49_000193 [Ktedonobacterales bacterium]|nr:MAG: hypothetical protein OJF49_000193 [Ktedonobacterales bacterium]